MMLRTIGLAVGLLVVGGSMVWAADDTDLADKPQSSVEEWIQKFDSPRFTERQNASNQLFELGEQAIPALEKAALKGSRETTTRSIDILKRHWENGTEQLKKKSKEALQRLSESDKPAAASRAKEALNPKPKVPQGGPIQILPGIPGQIQIQIQAQAGGNKRVKMKVVNGVKDIEVDDNGKKIKIHDDPNQGIKIEVTEKKDGKETTKKYEAKNADELKKKHPEAHKIYEQYSKGQGGIQIRGIQIRPGQIPAFPFQPRQLPNFNGDDARKRIAKMQMEQAQRQLDNAHKQLKKLGKDKEGQEDLDKAIEKLADAQKQLEEAIKRLEQ